MGRADLSEPFSAPESTGESALLADLRAGRDEAYGRLVRTYGPRLRATAMRFLRNDADANDAVQETFLAAFRNLGAFDGRCQIGTWLHRIGVNVALMKIRSRKRHPEVDLHALLPRFEDGGQHLEPQIPFEEMPDDPIRREETAGLVREAIARLPEKYRNAVMLRDIEGMDNADVARELGLTLNATRIRVHRARQALRTLLAPHFGTERE